MISKLGFYHNFFIVAILLHGLSLMTYDCRKSCSLFSCPLATQYCQFFAPHTLVGETFVARLIYYSPIHSFWPGDILLQPGYNHYCQSIITEKFWTVIERVIVQTNSRVPLAVCNNNLIAKYSNRWNFFWNCLCVAGLQLCSLPHTDLEILLQSSGFLPHTVMAVSAGWLTLSR